MSLPDTIRAMSPPRSPQIVERALTFGDGATLVAVTSETLPATADAGRPAVLVLNAGIVHRIGPARNSVELARHIAREGFFVMRFDLSGIGDSEPRKDGLSIEEHAVVDIRQAMDHLESARGVTRFVLVGLCSGADNSFRVAGLDPRVVGAVLIDGYGYRTREYYVRYFGRRSLKLSSYPGFARRLGGALVKRVRPGIAALASAAASGVRGRSSSRRREIVETEPTAVAPIAQWQRVFPPREVFVAELEVLVERGVKLLFIYTASVERYYNYDRQLGDCVRGLDLRGSVDAELFENSDHTLTELASKSRLRASTIGWLARRFPARPSPSPVLDPESPTSPS